MEKGKKFSEKKDVRASNNIFVCEKMIGHVCHEVNALHVYYSETKSIILYVLLLALKCYYINAL